MISAFSWQNSVTLRPASFCTIRTNLPVTPGISSLPTFAFQSSMMKRTSFSGVSSRRSCRSSYNHPTSASSALLVGAQTWITMILNDVPGKLTEINLSFLRLHPSTEFQTLLLTMMAIPFLLRDSCPHWYIQWSSELNSPIQVHLSSLIPRMSTVTLAISCLTTSNLP